MTCHKISKLPEKTTTLTQSETLKSIGCHSEEQKLSFFLFKKEQRLELWSKQDTCRQLIKTYAVNLNNTSSGTRLYDYETIIPEGIYRFNSLSDSNLLSINFPNDYDKLKAIADNRPALQTSIALSTAFADSLITLPSNDFTELYTLLKHLPIDNISLVILPTAIQQNEQFPPCFHCPPWVPELYSQLKMTLVSFQH